MQKISDRIFVKYVLREHYMSDNLIEECRRLQTITQTSQTLAEIALSQNWLDQSQLEMISEKAKRKLMFGGYRVHKILGEGGLAVVYLARQVSMNRDVALKVLYSKWNNDDEFRKRFLLEARVVGSLSHPNLIQVYDVGRDQSRYYFSMEYVKGPTLEQIVEQDGPMPLQRALTITMQILEALNYIWGKNLVHRDIKPSNIMMAENSIAKLGDFGFVKTNLESKITNNDAIGTPDYMSPEQARGQADLDYRSDIYSLGATLYHIITGQVPFNGTESKVIEQHLAGQIPSPCALVPELPESISLVISKMMAKSSRDRYQSYDEIKTDIEMILQEKQPMAMLLEAGKSTVASCTTYIDKHAQIIISNLKGKIKLLQHREQFYLTIIMLLFMLLISLLCFHFFQRM